MAADDDDDELTRLALEEFGNTTKRAKARSETMGALAWSSKGRPQTNKKYLHNTLIGAVQTNQRIEKNTKQTNPSSSKEKHSSSENEKTKKSLNDDKNSRKTTHNAPDSGSAGRQDRKKSKYKDQSPREETKRDRSPIERPSRSK